MFTSLADLRALAREKGWAVGEGWFELLRAEAEHLGWIEVATRRGDPTVTELRPVATDVAHPRSLSATYGTGRQPLHTDGAHLRTPPDLIVMTTDEPNSTPTQLWSPWSNPANAPLPHVKLPEFVQHGVFLVNGGSDRFLATAYDSASGWRYDPGCMTPCDQRARDAVRYFEDAAENTHLHRWSEAHRVLVIDNRKALHARMAVDEQDGNRRLRRIALNTGE
jgi:hypothetical protein